MKFKILSIITLTLSMLGAVNAATAPKLVITGAVTPWAPNATSVALDNSGSVQEATGIFSDFAGGTITNIVTVLGLDITTGDYSAQNLKVFDAFTPIGPNFAALVDTYFVLQTVDSVESTTVGAGQALKIDTTLKSIINGVDEGIFEFRWELSHNGNTGSYSVSTPVAAVPVPAATWLFGSAFIGLLGFTSNKRSVNN